MLVLLAPLFILKVLLSKQKENGDTEFATGYFNSTAIIIGFNKYLLEKSFQEVLHKLEIGLINDLLGQLNT